MNGKIEQGLHEKLCAYVLGESEGADRAEVERELLRSPELRAERERLESTIGAVRDALAPTETLTPEAKEALERAVRPAPIAQFPWLRLAAGIGAVGLGWWIFAGAPTRQRDVTVAVLDREAVSNAQGEGDRWLEKGMGRAAETEIEQVVPESRAYGTDAKAKADPATRPLIAAVEALEQKSAGGAVVSSDGSATPAPVPAQASSTTGIVRVAMPKTEEALLLLQTESTPAANQAQAVDRVVAGQPVTSVGLSAVSGPTKGVPGGPSAGGAKSSALATPGAAGSYRGPSDTKPPSTPALAQASSGPASAGPGLPLSGGAGGGKDGSSAGLAVPQELFEVTDGLKRLNELGYVGPADADAARVAEKQWRQMTPEEQARQLEFRCGTIVQDCLPRPNERPRDMFFRFWGDNPFEVTMLDKLSTFSADVDTASYALARRYLEERKIPEKAQVRTEEFVNYFDSDVDAPRSATFSVHSDLTPSRFSADSARQMLRVVVRAKDVEKLERQPMHLTFVVDVSGSMKEQDRLETVKHALRMLVAQLDGRDSIALVTFSNDAKLVLPMTPVVDRAAIEAAIAPLAHGGSTNSNAGLQLGYAQALMGLDPNAVNRVVFLSDGVANVGETDAQKILEGVQSIREKGIFLNTIGVGMNNHNDVLLEQLADKGDGLCNYVDSPKEIQRALVDRFTGAFQPVAKDVKIQVEFDPQQVMRYRLLGYENRAIADADFRNDAVDAGELGAGHQVTALYEIEPTGRTIDGPMATVRLRWKPIRAAGVAGVQEANEASFEVNAKSYQAFESSPPGHRRALIVAQFAEILRRSIHARGESLDDLIAEASRLQAQIPGDKDFAEFTALVLRAKDTILRTLPACDEMCQTIDALRSNQYLGAVIGESGRDPRTLEEIERTRRDLEQRLRELLRQEAERGDRPRVR
ncbi:MAG: von Willebrand factor type A domain-containing protein [Planctomycetota bacterium]|nr:von Willebrand factor type A domain-containing protein [Planctomycetota bacterium]